MLAAEIRDPREGELPAAGRILLQDPETGAQIDVDTSSAALRRRFVAVEHERRERLAAELRRLRVTHVDLSTASEWLRVLGAGMR